MFRSVSLASARLASAGQCQATQDRDRSKRSAKIHAAYRRVQCLGGATCLRGRRHFPVQVMASVRYGVDGGQSNGAAEYRRRHRHHPTLHSKPCRLAVHLPDYSCHVSRRGPTDRIRDVMSVWAYYRRVRSPRSVRVGQVIDSAAPSVLQERFEASSQHR